jgi:hypothetical protein
MRHWKPLWSFQWRPVAEAGIRPAGEPGGGTDRAHLGGPVLVADCGGGAGGDTCGGGGRRGTGGGQWRTGPWGQTPMEGGGGEGWKALPWGQTPGEGEGGGKGFFHDFPLPHRPRARITGKIRSGFCVNCFFRLKPEVSRGKICLCQQCLGSCKG